LPKLKTSWNHQVGLFVDWGQRLDLLMTQVLQQIPNKFNTTLQGASMKERMLTQTHTHTKGCHSKKNRKDPHFAAWWISQSEEKM